MRSPDPSIRAEELFNRWLSESREDASLDLDEWAAGESADVLAELRRRVEELSSLRRLVGGTLLTLSPGQRFGDFELKRELGRGGMGVVWQARDTRVQRDVALKFLEPGSLLSNEKFARFEREAQASGKLMHEGIVRLLSVGEAAETHYLVLELVPRGRTLADWNRHVHSESMERDHYLTVARLFERVCTALEYAHSQGVIHRDIKPQNILLDPQDVPKVTDFGLARIEDALALTKTGNTPGTCYYMSPEQAGRAKSLVDHRTDIFSLGVTLYETLTARRPFEGTTEFEVLEHIRRVRPVHPQQLDSSIPRQLATLCLKAIEKHPADRFATMAELAADLDRFARGVPIQTQPPGPIERAVKWARRKPVLAASSALLFVALSTVAWLAFTLGAERSVFASATRFDHVDEIAEMLDDGDVDGARKRYDQVPGDLRELWSMRHFWALITNGATFEPGPPLWAGALARDTDAVLLAPESGALQWDLGPDRIVAAPPSALAITPNGRRVLTLESQTIRWALVGEGWSDARWQPEGPVKSVALHPTTDAYAWIEDNGAFTVANWGGEGKLLTLTTIDEDEDEDEDDHPTGATQVAFNASGTRVAWCGPKSLRVFKQGSRGELQSVYRWENPETKSDKAPIHAFAVLGDGSQCLTLQSTGRLRLFGELPGAVTRVFHSGVAGGRMYVETSLSVLADREDLGRLTCLAAVSERDPFYVGTAQGNVLSIDLQVGNRLGLRRTYSSSANDVLDVVLRGSQLVALCEDGTRVTWDAYARAAEGALDPLLTEDSGELQQLLRCGYALPRTVFPDYMPLGPLRSAEQIAVHPTGQAAACIDRAGRWRVGTPPFNATEDIDVKPGTPGRPSRRLTWARGARRLAYIDSENRVQVMDVDSGVTSSSEPLAGEVEVLALDQGGRRVAAGMRDGSVQVWQPAAQQDANAHSQPDSTWSDWHSQGQRISALFWTEAGQLWVADRSGAVASLADADTRLGGWQLASDEIGHLCVTPDGKTFAIATDLEVQLFELDVVESGKLKASFTRELKPTVLALTFTNEEDLLAFTETGEGLAYRVRAAHTGSEMQVEEQLAGLARQLRNEFVFTEAIRAHLNGREDLTTDERQQLTLMVERQPDRDLRDVVEDVHRITNSRMEYPARYGWALRHARAAVSILPEHRAPASNSSEDRSASFALAAALFRTGAYEESLSTFEATLARNASVMDSDSEAGAYAVAALCARELERGDPAAAYFARAQALIPTDRTRNAYVLEARRAFEE